MLRPLIAALSLTVATATGWITASPARAMSADAFAIRNVRVFDGARILEHRTVVVESGRISRLDGPRTVLPPGLRVVDGTGRTLLPGLIDAHVHVSSQRPEAALKQSLWFGVTTELDMFTTPDGLTAMKRLRAEARPDLTDTRSAGIGVTVPGGHPTEFGGPPFPTLGPGVDPQPFVDARIAEGSDYIKVIYDDCSGYGPDIRRCPTLDPKTLRALVLAAHRRGKLVVAHIGTEAQAREAILAGADGLAHVFVGPSLSPDFARLAARRRVFVIPTLAVQYWWCGRSNGPKLAADPELKSLLLPDFRYALSIPPVKRTPSCAGADLAVRALARAGVPLLAGTDSPAPGTAYGASLHDELGYLAADGLSPIEALKAATSTPARIFGLSDRGVIRVGARADLVLVDGDPSRDIGATRRIVTIWKAGSPVARP